MTDWGSDYYFKKILFIILFLLVVLVYMRIYCCLFYYNYSIYVDYIIIVGVLNRTRNGLLDTLNRENDVNL
jgi:hypothetical protein